MVKEEMENSVIHEVSLVIHEITSKKSEINLVNLLNKEFRNGLVNVLGLSGNGVASVAKILKGKDEEIQHLEKLNWILQETTSPLLLRCATTVDAAMMQKRGRSGEDAMVRTQRRERGDGGDENSSISLTISTFSPTVLQGNAGTSM
ncbi:hypothetical protein LR48_Vigan492s001100 [Vigna angularis]|uniref:Uncharacterized protein n=1 Tax=Phaseolus angularis TaxID=3914 RepID=A0A0L9TC07_PHAAN|nr:hypothetical protein LR48_Vigan492s001100 [Vigna angularis]